MNPFLARLAQAWRVLCGDLELDALEHDLVLARRWLAEAEVLVLRRGKEIARLEQARVEATTKAAVLQGTLNEVAKLVRDQVG